MFLFMSKIHRNGNFINLQCTSIRIKHLLQGVGHIKLYSCSRAMLNYSIITGGPSSQMSIPVHTVVQLYSASNDPRRQMIPRLELVLKLDCRWSRTANDPRCGPQIIPPENEESHGVCSSGQGFNFEHKQKQVIANHILHGYTEFHDKEFFG